jgi:hypothetical protein
MIDELRQVIDRALETLRDFIDRALPPEPVLRPIPIPARRPPVRHTR